MGKRLHCLPRDRTHPPSWRVFRAPPASRALLCFSLAQMLGMNTQAIGFVFGESTLAKPSPPSSNLLNFASSVPRQLATTPPPPVAAAAVCSNGRITEPPCIPPTLEIGAYA